jgi:hypothetical protein
MKRPNRGLDTIEQELDNSSVAENKTKIKRKICFYGKSTPSFRLQYHVRSAKDAGNARSSRKTPVFHTVLTNIAPCYTILLCCARYEGGLIPKPVPERSPQSNEMKRR